MARVRIEREYGFVDSKGTLCVPVRFWAAFLFSGPVAPGDARLAPRGAPQRRSTGCRSLFFFPGSGIPQPPFTKAKAYEMIGGKGWGDAERRGEMIIPLGLRLCRQLHLWARRGQKRKPLWIYR